MTDLIFFGVQLQIQNEMHDNKKKTSSVGGMNINIA